MSFNFWLQTLQSTCGLGSGRRTRSWWSFRRRARQSGPQRRPRSAPLGVLQLETRLTPSLSTLASFAAPDGIGPQAGLIMDGSGNLYGTTFTGGASDRGNIFELAEGSGTLTSLASFNGANGANPRASLIMDGNGNLYGTASLGGASNDGTVFELAQGSGTITTLASFNGTNGADPYAALIMDGNGNLFGTTYSGGASRNSGTVFELAQGSGTIIALASFNVLNGPQHPEAGLIMDSSGDLFGTANAGGASQDGTVFELVQGSGTVTTLASFNGTNGAKPQSALVRDSNGNLFGTANIGGPFTYGTVFELAQGSSTITMLASFNKSDGARPEVGLIMDGSGNLYGTTSQGGASSDGTVFEIAQGSKTITTLASFTVASEYAYAGLTIDGNGNLFGTTYQGGTSNDGAVYELAQGSGTITTLASFNDSNGSLPAAGLISDSSGDLFSTTAYGGAFDDGTVFELASGSGTITTLASFNGTDGRVPYAGLIMDGNGNLYGTTVGGGASSDGTVFELVQGSGTITTLASFNGTNGTNPYYAGLIMDSSGNLYGTTESGGASSDGTVFELVQGSGTITTLASFNGTNGANPYAGLVMDSGGTLYGTTEAGGASKDGTVFKVAKGSGTITTLVSFNGTNGANPEDSLILDSNGNLYGTTYGGGTVFEFAKGSSKITTLASFNATNGGSPMAGLVMDSSGNLYGTTVFGPSGGSVFELAHGSGAITTLTVFSGANGLYPYAGLIMDGNGHLYGTTGDGGAGGLGTVFEITSLATTFVLGGFPSPDTAGAAGTFTVTAENASGGVSTDYTGTVHFTSSDPQAGLPADYTFTAADQGVHTFSATLETAGTQSLTAADSTNGLRGSESGITVNPAAANTFKLTGYPSPTNAGLPGNFTVTAWDAFGNLATGYTGTASFSSSDGSATPPANYSYTSADAGVHTFSATMNTAGTQSLTATDTTTSGVTGSQTGITVNPAGLPAARFGVAGFPSSTTAGVAGTITVTARDANGNVAPSYRGTVHFSSSDAQAVLPANYTFTNVDQGVHTFTVTLKTAGTRSITATDTATGSITGSESGIAVKPAAASQFILSAPSSVAHSVAFSLTLTVEDAYGNVVTGYVGTVHFSSSDSTATLPANYTFTAGDAGVHTFANAVTLKKKGTQTITVTDMQNSALTVTNTMTVV